jgi:hypothetical protein
MDRGALGVANGIIKQARVEDTRHDLDGLSNRVGAWLIYRRERDRLRQYGAGLDALDATFSSCLEAVRVSLDLIDLAWPVGEVYGECRAADRRLALIGRVFEWYATRFDQRDDPALSAFLAAADEVTWSCYAPVFRHAYLSEPGRDAPYGQVPLPYLESEYAPRALARDLPPAEIRAERTDTLLAEFLDRLPLAVIGLPMAYLETPWQLVLLAHEVGHHVQSDLVSDGELVEEFGNALAKVAPGEAAAERWRRWGSEVFADCCLAVSAGPWAVQAIAELELADQRTMLANNRVRYPSAIARLELLAEATAQLGLDRQLGLLGLEPAELAVAADGTAAEDIALAPAMAARALRHSLSGFGTFTDLYGFNPADFATGGKVHAWADAFCAGIDLPPEPSLRAPRLLAASAVQAWNMLAATPDSAQRADSHAALRERLLRMIAQSRELGVRAAASPTLPEPSRVGKDLSDLLRERIRDRPG